MKLVILKEEFESQPLLNQLFLALWKQKKGYHDDLSLSQLIELACALTPDLSFDDSDGRVFNNSLHYGEFHIAWDGSEPLDVLWFELNQKLKRRITNYLVVANKVE